MENKTDKDELSRIRRKVNDPNAYGKMVDSIHTWDVAAIFTDFRAVIQIARRALKKAEQK